MYIILVALPLGSMDWLSKVDTVCNIYIYKFDKRIDINETKKIEQSVLSF